MLLSTLDISAESFVPNGLHRDTRNWIESNCYIDMWIEILHALELDPLACFGFSLTADFEQDQWTFLKPPLVDLRRLYGLVVEEMNVWLPLIDHCENQVRAGRLVTAEVDAFYLPDTSQSDYQRVHTKTTIAINQIDRSGRFLGYFHNAGYYQLEGDDFDGIFSETQTHAESGLPPYCELIKLTRCHLKSQQELRVLSRQIAVEHMAFRPATNPVAAMAAEIEASLSRVVSDGDALTHAWVFSNLRQLGAGYELAALYLNWLSDGREKVLDDVAQQFMEIGTVAKKLVLKVARMSARGQYQDISEAMAGIATLWDSAYEKLETGLSA